MHLLLEAEFWVAVAFVIFFALLAKLGAHRLIIDALDARAARIKADIPKWAKVIRDANIKLEQ